MKNGGASRSSNEKLEANMPKFLIEKLEETKKVRFEVVKIMNKTKEA